MVTVSGERPQHAQADRCILVGGGEQERGCRGAGDQQEDHRVVEALQPPARARAPAATVVQGAGPEQPADGRGVDGDRGDPCSAVGAGQQQRADHQRGLEPEQVQPAAQRRFGVVEAAAGVTGAAAQRSPSSSSRLDPQARQNQRSVSMRVGGRPSAPGMAEPRV
jgi:hypothetical protein